MGRVFLIVFLGGLLVVAIAVVVIGEFPPHPHPQPVQTVLPNSNFQSK